MASNDDMTIYLIDSCIPIKCYDMCIFTPFFLFVVFVPMGYIYPGRGALIADRLEGGDRDLVPLF